MKRKEAVKTVKEALGAKATDRRTRVSKAVLILEDWASWDEKKIEGIIDETIEQFESKDNDYFDGGS